MTTSNFQDFVLAVAVEGCPVDGVRIGSGPGELDHFTPMFDSQRASCRELLLGFFTVTGNGWRYLYARRVSRLQETTKDRNQHLRFHVSLCRPDHLEP